MAQSSILGGERAPKQATGRGTDLLGPSDSSDSGSDVQGERAHATSDDKGLDAGAIPSAQRSDSDAAGTGERGAAIADDAEPGADILPDRVDDLFGDEVDPETGDVDDLADEAADDDEPSEPAPKR